MKAKQTTWYSNTLISFIKKNWSYSLLSLVLLLRLRCCYCCLCICATVLVSEAAYEMVIRESNCLHEGVNNCRTNTAEASAYKIFTYKLSFRCLDGDLSLIPELALCRLVVHKIPHVLLKWSVFSYNLDEVKQLTARKIIIFKRS